MCDIADHKVVPDVMEDGRWNQAHAAYIDEAGFTYKRDYQGSWGPLVVPVSRGLLSQSARLIFDDGDMPTRFAENLSESPTTKTAVSELRILVCRAIEENNASNLGIHLQVGFSYIFSSPSSVAWLPLHHYGCLHYGCNCVSAFFVMLCSFD
jgi:hypothetical protein